MLEEEKLDLEMKVENERNFSRIFFDYFRLCIRGDVIRSKFKLNSNDFE